MQLKGWLISKANQKLIKSLKNEVSAKFWAWVVVTKAKKEERKSSEKIVKTSYILRNIAHRQILSEIIQN